MKDKLDLSGKGKASDLELMYACDCIFDILKEFASPKDAACALALAHFKLIKAAFPPKFKTEAIVALDAHNKTVKEFVEEGWQ